MNKKISIAIIVLVVIAALVACICLFNDNKPTKLVNKKQTVLPIFDAYMNQRGYEGKVTNNVLENTDRDRHFELMQDVSSIELMTPYREKIPYKWTYNTSGIGFEKDSFSMYFENAVDSTYLMSEHYEDSFLTENTAKPNKELAIISAYAAAVSYRPNFAAVAMQQCGFTYDVVEPSESKNDYNHVAFVVGHKVIDCQDVIAIWIRGTNNKFEWMSNFEIGRESEHEGFSLATDEVQNYVFEYINKHNIGGNVRFWVCGHSRGGAVANLLSARLERYYDKSKIYSYTFASPRVSTKARANDYIKNYIIESDFVADLAPKDWGYERHGKDYTLKIDDKVKNKFTKVTQKGLYPLSIGEKKELLKAFMDYGGDGVDSYYTRNVLFNTVNMSPADVLKDVVSKVFGSKLTAMDGVSIALSAVSGVANNKSVDDLVLFYKLYDYKDKLVNSHCMTTYMSAID